MPTFPHEQRRCRIRRPTPRKGMSFPYRMTYDIFYSCGFVSKLVCLPVKMCNSAIRVNNQNKLTSIYYDANKETIRP